MDEFQLVERFVSGIVERASGPMKMRLLIQPALAIFLAVRAGLADARTGKPPYFWTLFTDAGHRREMLKDGWKGIGKVFIMAMILDTAYQLIATHRFRLLPALVIAIILALIPYLAVRGPVTRLARK